jgi:predicted small lipoprotein YifL
MAKWCSRPAFTKILLWLVAAAISATISTGCGKKGPPKLPDVEAPIGVSDLSVKVAGGDIVLSWTATVTQEEASSVEGYLIYRSAEPLSNDDCEGCPVLFKRGAKVPLVDKDSNKPAMIYKEPLLPATRYRFKVVPYDAQGQLGPDSNIVRIVTD